MRILVIGGTSFMGPAAISRLSEQGHDITVFHRGQTEADLPSTIRHIHTGKGTFPVTFSPDNVNEFRQFAPDVVLHMVLFGEQDARETVNTFKGIARRLVVISSQDVYRAFGRVNNQESGPPEAPPITEDSPLRENLYPYRNEPPRDPDDPRAWMDSYDKIPAEQIVMNEPELPATVLRLPMVYGPRDKQHRLFSYLKRMNDHRPVILLDEAEARWRWTHGYVENVAAAIALAITDERASGRIYNVGEIEAFPLIEWVQQIGQAVGWQGRIVLVPQGRLVEPLAMGVNAAQDIVVDSSRMRKELGYTEPVSLDEALRRTIEWEQAHPPANINPAEFDYAAEDTILAQLK
ncbi:MAG TPA: NAD-dependent epimerase/dehydratase family protein [Ktedonobacteraceae bacterium]